jgi:hypothetical protein
VAERIAEAGDRRVLKDLEPWLTVEDRHLRGNAAFVFARFGDPRGFETLRFTLTDYSYRPEGQGIPGGSFNMEAAAWSLASQISGGSLLHRASVWEAEGSARSRSAHAAT